MVLRDSSGSLIFSSGRHLSFCSSALESELAACLEGFTLTLQWCSTPIHIKSDCLELVNLITSGGQNRSAFTFLIREIKLLMSTRESCITHISRGQNVVSDYLANYARTEGRTAVWLHSGPGKVETLCHSECNMAT